MHAVIFDIDGTLLQSASIDDAMYRQAVQFVLGPVNVRASLTDYDFVTDSGLLQQIHDDNSIAVRHRNVKAIKARFFDDLAQYLSQSGPFEEIPGAKNAFNTLKASQDHCVAVATGGWRKSALLKLNSAGFDISGVPVATSDDAHERTEIMRRALAALGSGFESITYYGDGPWDREASAALGWDFVAVGPELNGITSYSQSIL